MNHGYLMRRLAWRWFPGLLNLRLYFHKIPVQHGIETLMPQVAVDRYLAALNASSFSIQGKSVFILGYGGCFAVGCKLLSAGARSVALYDPYARPDDSRNQKLLPEYGEYLWKSHGRVLPRSRYMTLHEKDLRQIVQERSIEPVDLVLSSSVLEHVKDVEGTVEGLNRLTRPDGFGLHFIDLCDHLYSYPFEMLSYSPFTWHYWLNPGSHLNRYRVRDYRLAFSRCYAHVSIIVEQRDEQSFQQAAEKIRPEFKTGDMYEDSATFIRVTVRSPRQ